MGTTPRTINPGRPDENGNVEAAQRHLKRRLILRGSRDFPALEDYDAFVGEVCTAANRQRAVRLAEEFQFGAGMRFNV